MRLKEGSPKWWRLNKSTPMEIKPIAKRFFAKQRNHLRLLLPRHFLHSENVTQQAMEGVSLIHSIFHLRLKQAKQNLVNISGLSISQIRQDQIEIIRGYFVALHRIRTAYGPYIFEQLDLGFANKSKTSIRDKKWAFLAVFNDLLSPLTASPSTISPI